MDLNKIPEEEFPQVRSLIIKGELMELYIIHNKYKLSNKEYGCCGLKEMLKQFQKALSEFE